MELIKKQCPHCEAKPLQIKTICVACEEKVDPLDPMFLPLVVAGIFVLGLFVGSALML